MKKLLIFDLDGTLGDTVPTLTESMNAVLAEFSGGEAILHIVEKKQAQTELPVRLVLYQGLPKKDKMELIVQKAVELGAAEIVPVMTKRCIVKLEDDKKEAKKIERWQAIAESAAKQSGRSIIPTVSPAVSFKQMLELAKERELALFCYESEDGRTLKDTIGGKAAPKTLACIIGCEGGFSPEEVEEAISAGCHSVTLGKRILRCETAPSAVLSMILYQYEM